MNNIKFIFILPLIIAMSVNAYAAGLGSLAEVGKSQEAMQKVLDQETESYEELKEAIEKGELSTGESQDMIARRYGDPVIVLKDSEYAEKWAYKPAYASWFDNKKIYLFFDSDRKLAEIVEF